MATTVGELNVKLNLELQRLDAQINDANAKIKRMSKKMKDDMSAASQAAKMLSTALGAIGIGLSAGALVSLGKSFIDLGGNIVDVAAKANISTDALQTLHAVGMDSGVTYDDIANSLNHLQKSLEDAAEGSQPLQKDFNALGLNVKALQSLAPERQFELIGRSILGAKDQNEAFNAALEILGTKSAPKLMAFLKTLGADGFDKLAESTKNIRLSPEQLAILDDAGDKLAKIAEQLKVIGAKGVISIVKTFDSSVKLDPSESPELQRARFGYQRNRETLGEDAELTKKYKAEVDRLTASQVKLAASGEAVDAALKEFFDPIDNESLRQYNDSLAETNAKIELNNRISYNSSAQVLGLKTGYDSAAVAAEKYAAMTSKLNDAAGMFGSEAAPAFDSVIDKATLLKEVGQSLDAYKPFVFDPNSTQKSTEQLMRESEALHSLAEQAKDALDPMRKIGELREQLNKAVSEKFLSQDQADAYLGQQLQSVNDARMKAIDDENHKFFDSLDEESNAHLKELFKAQQQVARQSQMVVDDLGSGMTDAFVDFFNGTTDGFKNLGKMILQEIQKILVQVLIVKPLLNMLGGAMGGGGGWGGAVAAAFQAYGGSHADGGVAPGNRVSLVGERGPELIMPRSDRMVVPTHKLAGAMGGGSQYNFNYQFASGIQRAELMPLLERKKAETIGTVADLVSRAGQFRKAMNR